MPINTPVDFSIRADMQPYLSMCALLFQRTILLLLRGKGLNLRPLGYEPSELPLLHPVIYDL